MLQLHVAQVGEQGRLSHKIWLLVESEARENHKYTTPISTTTFAVISTTATFSYQHRVL